MIYAIGAIVSFIIYLLVGLIVSKKVKNVKDYYVSGRNAPTLLIVGSLVASYLSTVTFMGDASFSYEGYGIPQLISSIFEISGYVLGVLFFGRFLRRSESLTLPEFFGERFQSKAIRRVAAITLIIGITAYLVAVMQGAGVLLSQITGMGYASSLILATFVFTAITFFSGAKGVLVTDTLMFLVFSVATFISIPYILKASGGVPDALINASQLTDKAGMMNWHGILGEGAYMGSPMSVLLWTTIIGFVWGSVIAVSPWQTSRYLMAKNEHVAVRSAVIAAIVVAVIYLFFHITMITVNVVNPNVEPIESVFIWSAMNLVPKWVGVVAISGILAAALSTASTFLQLIGNSVSWDLVQSSSFSDKKLLRLSRFVVLAVAGISFLITLWQPPAIFWISVFAATLFAAAWGPVAFTSVLWKRVTRTGALWSMSAGTAVVALTELLESLGVLNFPVYLNSAVFGGASSIIALITGSLLTVPSREEKSQREKLLELPEEEKNLKEINRTRKLPGILFVSGAFIIAITFLFYYIPLYT